jgi:receptor expression-enhancing protein 5/6
VSKTVVISLYSSSNDPFPAFYFVFKTLFTIWLMLPATRGAETLWRTFVQPAYRNFSGQLKANTPTTGYATNTNTFNAGAGSFNSGSFERTL